MNEQNEYYVRFFPATATPAVSKKAALTASKSRSLSTRSASWCSSFPRLQASILRQGEPLWPAALAAMTAWSTSSCVDKRITSTSWQDNSVNHVGSECLRAEADDWAASNGGKQLASSLDQMFGAFWCWFRSHRPAKHRFIFCSSSPILEVMQKNALK